MLVRLFPAAESDFADIVDYYSNVSSSLSERFISELDLSLNRLIASPSMGSPRYAHFLPDRSLRVWQLKHFPFLIFYRLDHGTLAVLRVLHERRALAPEMISV